LPSRPDLLQKSNSSLFEEHGRIMLDISRSQVAFERDQMNNPLSFSSLKLELFSKDGIRLKPASGFVIEARNQYYLITNRHIVSIQNTPGDQQQEPVLEPHMLKTSIHIHWGEGEKSFPLAMGMRKRITIPLYDDKNSPTWIERPLNAQHRLMADIVALPIQLNETYRLTQALMQFSQKSPGSIRPTNYWSKVSAIPASAIDTDVEYGPSDPVQIIGYPLGWAPEGPDRSSSAFWRTGFIASEIYEAGMTRSDTFFVDPCAPEGMTGSPVVGLKNDRLKLLGVYSDRSTAEFGANAGVVWGAWLAKELISAS
jgi:hypothetical protein